MRLKLDESFGRRGAEILAAAGHDVATVSAREGASNVNVGNGSPCRSVWVWMDLMPRPRSSANSILAKT